jgi:GT2 family glycosyltransferase/glycosyltransferase involved in cell wall biosynthesis
VGFFHISGWLRVDHPEQEAVLVARVNGIEIATAILENLTKRDDIASVGGMAFDALLIAPHTDPTALSFSLRIADRERPADSVYETTEPFRPRGFIEHVGRDGMRGWIFDPGNLLGDPSTLVIDDRWPIDFLPSVYRKDLPFPGRSLGALYGFQVSWGIIADGGGGIAGHLADPADHSVALISSRLELARIPFRYVPRIEGKFELVTETVATGWAVDRNLRGLALPVELLIDGTPFAATTAHHDRLDLISKGVTTAGGGFRFELPAFSPGRAVPQLEVRARASDTPLSGGGAGEYMEPRCEKHHNLLEALPVIPPSIAIVVPIHNAASDVERCLESIFANTRGAFLLILIDDASSDPSIADLLEAAVKRPNVRAYRNDNNLGFTRTANLGIGLAGRRDVILLNSDTIVGPGWAQGLLIAAHSQAGIATATALSNAAGVFSVPEIGYNEIPTWLTVEGYSRLVRQVSAALLPAVPTGNGFCMYIRRDALDRIGQFDEAAFPRGYGEENDFCMRADRQGLLNIVDDRTFVFHRRAASFGDEKTKLLADGRLILDQRYTDYDGLIRQFESDPDFRTLRWRVRHALRKGEEDRIRPRPRILYVISTTTGGTPQTNADLMEALSDRYEPWVLRCDSKTIELFRWGPDKPEAVERHRLARPLVAMVHKSGEYDRVVADWLLRHAFELVHIRHIAWHGLALPQIARRLGIPVVFSFHDFYTVCPTIKLLDENRQYCGGRCTASTGNCVAELWPEGDVSNLKHQFVQRWREMMADMFAACDAFVTTSPGARQTMFDNFAILREADFRIIEHGRDFPAMEAMAATVERAEPLRIVVPGNISTAKGADFINAVAAADIDGELEFHILGDHGTVEPARNVVLHGQYRRDELADHIRAIRPHIGAILSIWPETYCHTLTELWACGVPVFVFDMGALGERLREYGGGWLVAPDRGAAGLFEELRALKHNQADIRSRVEAVLGWQHRKGRYYDRKAMGAQYDALYRSIFSRDRPFDIPEEHEASDAPVILYLVEAPAGLSLATRNGSSRKLIYRPVAATYPWGRAEAGPGDALLICPEALRPAVLDVLVEECLAADLPMIVDAPRLVLDDSQSDLSSRLLRLLASAALVLVEDHSHGEELIANGCSPDVIRTLTGEGPLKAATDAVIPDDGWGWEALDDVILGIFHDGRIKSNANEQM